MINVLYPSLLSPGGSISANALQGAGAGGLQIKALISLGIFCDRTDIYNFGISSVQHNGTYSYGFVEYVNPSGQNYENQRDIGHASGNLGAFAESFYMAWNQGLDLFSLSNNLLAKAYESQAKFDMFWDVAPIPYTAPDGGFHSKMSGINRTPYDNLESDLVYYIYHTVKGLNMPYTKMSGDLKFPRGVSEGPSFWFRVDNTGQVPTAPLYGEPAPTGVRVYEDYLSGTYLTNFAPGNYNWAALTSAGVRIYGSGAISSIKVPIGWTVTAYDADNFTGNSVVLTGTLANSGNIDLGTLGFNDKLTSMKVVGGGTYPIFNTTYRIINKNSAKAADVSGSSTANGTAVVQNTYSGQTSQLWRVEDIGFGNGQYKFTNLNSGKVMEVTGASFSDGAPIDQWTESYATSPNLAVGGTATASSGTSGQQAAQAFDGSSSTKWYNGVTGGTGYLQYQLGSSMVITQYRLTSANDVPQRDPAAWQFQGSNNGTTWTTLDTQTGQVFAGRYQTNTYNMTNTTAYAYYRLNVTANNGGSGYEVQLAEMGFYSTLGGSYQRWTLNAVSGSPYGTYLNLLNANSGKALDVSGGSTADGASIIQWPYSGGNNQQWSLLAP